MFTTIIGMCAIPALVRKATYTPDNYPFVYYSSVLKDLVYIDYKNKKTPMTDRQGKVYTTAEFDSVMPLLNYRQRMVDGTLPDSIEGLAITPPIVMSKSITFKSSPSKFDAPNVGLYIMFESTPKRIGLELPDDVFRMKNDIEFINDATNTVDEAKSQKFQKALDKAGYTFPAQWVEGNMNPRKRYDEGYFSLDSKSQLYHIKMVNGNPYVGNTGVGDSIEVSRFSMYESGDKRFYGFLFDKTGNIYIIGNDEGKYQLEKLDIPAIDTSNDELLIMGNLLYWTVSVTNSKGKDVYALKASTFEQVEKLSIPRVEGRWDKVSAWLFPIYITLTHENSDFIYPQVSFTGYYAFLVNLLLSIVMALFIPNSPKKKILQSLYVLITGIPGLIALLILPNISTRKLKKRSILTLKK